ncbi:S-adenosylmethionine:tRNA ribosyltransferase-isomerase [Acaryochloris thomasi RCC1774]|uniref:S-adenosylmethionine:tRNA ribosyltransferase-isomerase n=1 Tax=Acaryochloris thomasi RCC1774 TaxID=1764569 RepID=A0A2W1JFA4_9CYAN|nr:tRNA preQ1(34) S-adenosylmethionine ribosyltransferase-isomerase QueA [Acaryochloris thomasi]PZD72413.1 S-adenosylmethionine:tRNA ribosyltransferase-isomerase [Acaryochloris thomasi RCC1774]
MSNAPYSQDHCLSAYDYTLPETLIAQTPMVPRDRSRLLVVEPTTHQHRHFYELPQLLRSGDLLVLNNTRVIPARLLGYKLSSKGGQIPVEVLLLEPRPDQCWLALVKPGRRLKPGANIIFGNPEQPSLQATVLETDAETRGRIIQFHVDSGKVLEAKIHQLGQLPLPPYIHHSSAAPEQYQTVFAEQPGAVAAPTAGLHFTPQLLEQLSAQGIQQAWITLHVGLGTFRPVEIDHITDHRMHAEWIDISPATVAAVQQTQAQGGRIIAVGTTAVRALEGAAQSGTLQPYRGKTQIFIYPGYQWQVVDGLITNFHLPKSSLMMLVSALIGRQRLLTLYQEAIDERYRFYSFGDAMLIMPVRD